MKKKIIGSVLVLGIVAAAAGLFVPNAVQKITKESVITSSQLEKAVDISELSTAEFIYNGIADKYSDGNLEETECHIAYASTVKVGIALDQITFTIDEEKKTVQKENSFKQQINEVKALLVDKEFDEAKKRLSGMHLFILMTQRS